MFSPNTLVFGGGDAGMSHQLTTGKDGSLMYVCTVQYLLTSRSKRRACRAAGGSLSPTPGNSRV